jgi:hypothetical protein
MAAFVERLTTETRPGSTELAAAERVLEDLARGEVHPHLKRLEVRTSTALAFGCALSRAFPNLELLSIDTGEMLSTDGFHGLQQVRRLFLSLGRPGSSGALRGGRFPALEALSCSLRGPSPAVDLEWVFQAGVAPNL